MTSESHRIHVFFSAKGGVGKTTLALTCARLARMSGQEVAFLDMDFTGTSIADGFQLAAPAVNQVDGSLDLGSPAQRWHTVEETSRLRWRRYQSRQSSMYLPFLNDAFSCTRSALDEMCLAALAWRTEPDDGIAWFPSAAIAYDVSTAVEGYFDSELKLGWVRRLSHVMRRVLQALPATRTWVVDLPPGIFGFAKGALSLFAKLQEGRALPGGFASLRGRSWTVDPYLVTSEDHPDLMAALSHPYLHSSDLKAMQPVVNRATHPEAVRRFVKNNVPFYDLPERLRFVDLEPLVLGRIFQDERLDLPFLVHARPGLVRDLRRLFGLFEGELV